MARKDDDKELIFFIPKNYEEKNVTMSGLSYRNIIEALFLAGTVALVMSQISSLTLKSKFIIGLPIAMILGFIGLMGFNNCSLSEFLINFIVYKIKPNVFVKKNLFNNQNKN